MAQWPPAAQPGAFAALLETLAQCPPCDELDFAELFAGKGAVHRHLMDLGYRGKAMDREHCVDHDLLQPMGMVVATRIAASIRPGGVLWLAPPCSSWVWISRGSTGRNVTAVGDYALPAVLQHNALVERVALLVELVHRRGAHWIIEQPASSILWDYPAIQAVLRRHGLKGPCVLDMGAYGGSSPKATHLYGTAPYLHTLATRCTGEDRARLQQDGVKTTRRWTDASGRARCQGTADLKGTQAYPEGWGAAHAHAFAAHYGPPREQGVATAQEHVAQLAKLVDLHGLQEAWWLRDFLGERF